MRQRHPSGERPVPVSAQGLRHTPGPLQVAGLLPGREERQHAADALHPGHLQNWPLLVWLFFLLFFAVGRWIFGKSCKTAPCLVFSCFFRVDGFCGFVLRPALGCFLQQVDAFLGSGRGSPQHESIRQFSKDRIKPNLKPSGRDPNQSISPTGWWLVSLSKAAVS